MTLLFLILSIDVIFPPQYISFTIPTPPDTIKDPVLVLVALLLLLYNDTYVFLIVPLDVISPTPSELVIFIFPPQ